MATFDPERGWVVLRIVYDGAAFAGKTTTLRSLGASLGRPTFSGDEVEGRTLHFDWVDFVGGRYDGNPIRCQIVAVPGQISLAERRRRLLRDADAVVLVADSSVTAREETQRAMRELRELVAERQPPVGLILQANKRDAPDAAPTGEIERWFGAPGRVAVTETIASEGQGIRETFVLAVRLALDRVRELELRGDLPRQSPEFDSGEELLARWRGEESAAGGSTPEPATPVERREPVLFARTERILPPSGAPLLPTAEVPSGAVWPPVEGRVVLHEAGRARPVVERTARGDWVARHESWRWHSALDDLYEDLAAGRGALLDWARWHAQSGTWLSQPRAIALCEAAPGAYRLWQIVGRVPSIEDRLDEAVATGEPARIAKQLWRATHCLVLAGEQLVRDGRVHRIDAGVIAEQEGRLVFAGLVPPAPGAAVPGAGSAGERSKARDGGSGEGSADSRREQIAALVERSGLRGHPELGPILDRRLHRATPADRERYGDMLAAMLLGR